MNIFSRYYRILFDAVVRDTLKDIDEIVDDMTILSFFSNAIKNLSMYNKHYT